MTERAEQCEHRELDGKDAAGLVRHLRVRGHHSAEQAPRQLPPGDTERVPPKFADHRIARNRVPAVERDVRLVGSELFSVVRHVAASVEIDRDERREGDEPLPEEVVGFPIREQQPMGGFVHEDRKAGVDRPHREECRSPHHETVRPGHHDKDPDGDGVEHEGVRNVVDRRDAPQLFPECRLRLSRRRDRTVRVRRHEEFGSRNHDRGHNQNVTMITTDGAIT